MILRTKPLPIFSLYEHSGNAGHHIKRKRSVLNALREGTIGGRLISERVSGRSARDQRIALNSVRQTTIVIYGPAASLVPIASIAYHKMAMAESLTLVELA
jgi:hypothetical protein